MSKEKAQIGVKIAKKAERKQCLQFCIVKEQLACVFFILLAWMQTEEVR